MKTRNSSLKWKIFQYLLGFAGVMLVLLWLLQTVFLNDFYRAIKVTEIKNVAKQVELAVADKDAAKMTMVARRFDGCIVLADPHGYQAISNDDISACSMMYMMQSDMDSLMKEAIINGGSYLAEYEVSMGGRRPFNMIRGAQNIIYAKSIVVDGLSYGLLLNANVLPVDATVQTIRIQLIFVTMVMILLALILAFIISRRLTKPIVQITESSKELAKGNYNTIFDASGYREVEELAETLHYASVELGKVDGMQKELVANISHDLRTPLTMIGGYAELMRDLPGEMTQDNIQTIIKEAKRLTSLVNDVLDVSKLQSGHQILQLSPITLTQMLREIALRYQILMGHDGYQIDFQCDREVWIQADEIKLTQVIYNLMNNAITYTGDDKVVVIRQVVDQLKHQVTVQVIDTGEGLPEDQLAVIWDRYYKIDSKHRRAQVGSGLGLSIVKGILIMHEAEYGVSSIVGTGSTFWFTLPLIDEPQQASTEV